ncbi:hypothetical protein BN871_HM_00210 [Paenibacillus sp. P22]|nr:hypothetical protein BN871_HM_00210 [Paenibacillus sp. P22]
MAYLPSAGRRRRRIGGKPSWQNLLSKHICNGRRFLKCASVVSSLQALQAQHGEWRGIACPRLNRHAFEPKRTAWPHRRALPLDPTSKFQPADEAAVSERNLFGSAVFLSRSFAFRRGAALGFRDQLRPVAFLADEPFAHQLADGALKRPLADAELVLDDLRRSLVGVRHRLPRTLFDERKDAVRVLETSYLLELAHRQVGAAVLADEGYPGPDTLSKAQRLRTLRCRNHAVRSESDDVAVQDDEGAHLQRAADPAFLPFVAPGRRYREYMLRQIILARELAEQAAALVMRQRHVDLIARQRTEVDELRQLRERQQQLPSETDLEEAAETRMNVRDSQPLQLSEPDQRLFHRGGQSVVGIVEQEHFQLLPFLRLMSIRLAVVQQHFRILFVSKA